jgi:CRP-like cAMP-binding protein
MYVEAGHLFLYQGMILDSFYFVLEGKVAITLDVPDRAIVQPLSNQITGHLFNTDITISTVERGNILGWSALVPPNISTANAKAITDCRVVEFNIQALRPYIEQDCCFGHLLTLKAAQVIRGRLCDLMLESLAELV